MPLPRPPAFPLGRTKARAKRFKSDCHGFAPAIFPGIENEKTIFTIGHSTRTWPEFVALLKRYGIQCLADVRTVPKSRHVPHFAKEHLEKALPAEGIGYIHLAELGGMRHTNKDSPNGGWRNKSFRGYADYMQTREFDKGLDRLLALAEEQTTAIMCAEAVPWRCHRSLVGDALILRGYAVLDIFSKTKLQEEKLTSFAKTDGLRIVYPPS